MLLRDYAITPDVFDETSYPHPEACDAELRILKDVLLTEGLVRDLRAGDWSRVVADEARPWHRRGKELLKKLAQQNRLVRFECHHEEAPIDDVAWCREALGTHGVLAFTGGIIVTEPVKASFPGEDLVARIDRLSSAPWWSQRASSVTLRRRIEEYCEQLAWVLRCANSLMFIDPHLDPGKTRYSDFVQLLRAAGHRNPAPRIEIHRVLYEGSGPNRILPMRHDPEYFKRRFRAAWERALREAGLSVAVYLWDDFHDRFLISNLVGILVPNGFDISGHPNSVTRWTRLGREDRDGVQREFDPASNIHELCDVFHIPDG